MDRLIDSAVFQKLTSKSLTEAWVGGRQMTPYGYINYNWWDKDDDSDRWQWVWRKSDVLSSFEDGLVLWVRWLL